MLTESAIASRGDWYKWDQTGWITTDLEMFNMLEAARLAYNKAREQ